MAAKKSVVEVNSLEMYGKRPGGGWAAIGSFPGVAEDDAIVAAQQADGSGQYEAVRLMAVKTYPDGRPPLETIAWMSPHLVKGGKPKSRGKGSGGGETDHIMRPDADAPAPGTIGGMGGSDDAGGAGNGSSPEGSAAVGDDDAGAGQKRKRGGAGAEKASAAYKKLAQETLGLGGNTAAAAEDDSATTKPPSAATASRLITVVIISIVIGYIATIPAEIIIRALGNSNVEVSGFVSGNITFIAFLGAFIVSCLMLGKFFLKPEDIDQLSGLLAGIKTGNLSLFGKKDEYDEDEDDQMDHSGGLSDWRNDEDVTDFSSFDDADDADDADVAAPADRGSDTTGTGNGATDAASDDAVVEDDSDLDFPPSGVPEEPRKSMMSFLQGTLGILKSQLAKLDKIGKFGLNLYLAGAASALADSKGLDDDKRNGLITEAIIAIGTKKKMAGKFCIKFDDYTKDTKNKAMLEAGQVAMKKFLDGDPQALASVQQALESFTDDKAAKASSSGVVVIVFTDLVGSTQMTETLGDVGAQQVVRMHNAIVRNALSAYHGREVKHTGDGIMAAFANASNAIGATMVMQQEFAKNNATNPGLPIRVRIGMNAGVAVQEENDYFGATVQLSARVCDKANEAQIFITESVKDLVQGHSIQMRDAGSFDMKGVSKPVPVFEVIWNQQLQQAS